MVPLTAAGFDKQKWLAYLIRQPHQVPGYLRPLSSRGVPNEVPTLWYLKPDRAGGEHPTPRRWFVNASTFLNTSISAFDDCSWVQCPVLVEHLAIEILREIPQDLGPNNFLMSTV